MPKVSWGTSGDTVDEQEDSEFTPYDGPIPPAGVYRLAVQSVEYVKFSTGKKGLKVFALVDDNRTDRKRYNGCPVWENVVDGESTAFRIKQWLTSIGATGKDWDATVIDKDNMVQKFGRVKVDGLMVRAALKQGTNNDGEKRAEISRFLPPVSADEADESDSSAGDDDGEAPF